MELAWYMYVLALMAGIVAGIINTLAGSGSLVTLPMLVFLGLPAPLANGTNRVGVLFQNIIALSQYRRAGELRLANSKPVIVATILGALLGALIAVELDERAMELAIGAMMATMLVLMFLKPQRWLEKASSGDESQPTKWWLFPVFFAIGVYGGFIQAGVGIMLLVALVLGAGYSPSKSNTIKLLVILLFTLATLPVFMVNSQVHWGYGVLLGGGQGIGAYIGARFAINYPNANVWIRRLLIGIIVISIIKFFFL